MSHDGAGVGKADGYPLFIKDTVIGDKVRAKVIKAKKTYGYGRVEEILEASAHRTVPKCPIARSCGGCQLQMMDYAEQLRYKENKVRANMERIGGFKGIAIEPILGAEVPYGYRNKAQYPVGTDRNGKIVMGFYAGHSHNIIEQTNCLLGKRENEAVLIAVRRWMEHFGVPAYDERTNRGLIRHILIRFAEATKELMVCLVVNGRKLPHSEDLVAALREIPGMTSISISTNTKNTNVIMGDLVTLLWGQGYITDYIGPIAYRISPLSFFQVNPAQTKRLYETALSYAALTKSDTVWDLYCGIGTISLFLARQSGTVYGVEIIPQAIEDAKNNADLNGIDNAKFFVGKAEEVLPEKYRKEGISADVIVVDPPRKGCEESLLATMVEMSPKRIVYVSCDSATLARDTRYLCAHGYRIQRVQPVDMFAQTVHVETVVLLNR